ncbi:MAG TPA: OmpA family protein [Polyangiaceae bacterium]
MSYKFAIVALSIAAAACSKDTVKPPVAATPPPPAVRVAQKVEQPKVDEPHTAQAVTNLLGLDSEILRLCNLRVEPQQPMVKEGAPHFDFDESALSSEDTAVLQQVARCLTNGPLAGRHLQLIGRADSRGPTEYNFVLGANRASTVGKYLEQQGVESLRMNQTSRGELDAKGTDDATMRDDRRVDIMLGS